MLPLPIFDSEWEASHTREPGTLVRTIDPLVLNISRILGNGTSGPHRCSQSDPLTSPQYNPDENYMEEGGGIHAGFTLMSDKLKSGGYNTHAV